MTKILSFTKTKLPGGWLGNMSPFPIEYNGQIWKTSEHLFQAMRFEKGGDVWNEIQNCPSPMGTKFIMKRCASSLIVEPRSPRDLINMTEVLRLKFDQNTDIRKLLLDSGDDIIIEDVTKRQNESGLFWGAAKVHNSWWYGQNILGRMLMDLRKELQNER